MIRLDRAFVTNNARMRQRFEHVDLCRQLTNFLVRLVGQRDPLDGDNSTRVQVESTIDGSELTATDTFTQLLHEKKRSARIKMPACRTAAHVGQGWSAILSKHELCPHGTASLQRCSTAQA